MAMRAPLERSVEASGWPMTRQAKSALEADEARISREVVAESGYVSGHLDGEVDAPTFMPNVVGQQLHDDHPLRAGPSDRHRRT